MPVHECAKSLHIARPRCAMPCSTAYHRRRFSVNDPAADTQRARSRGVYVLVVHDPSVVVEPLCEALRALFIVREAATAFDALERLSGALLACVVCVVGGAIRGSDFLELVSHASPDQVRRLVFVDDGRGDSEFVRDTPASWVPSADPRELLAVVSAVSARR